MTIRHTSRPLRGAPPVERAAGVAAGGGPRFDPLPALWRPLESYPRLSSRFAVHRGIRWTSPNGARPDEAGAGRRRGLRGARRARQFRLPDPVSVDHRQVRPRRRTDLPWDRDKLVVTAARPTRGPWCIAAGLDREGLVCSEQFFALWPKGQVTDAELPAFAAILNGPVASAFLAAHAPAKGSRLAALKDVPVPPAPPARAAELAADYARRLREPETAGSAEGLEDLLTRIDAAVLGAYDLPASLEQRLLDRFRGSARPAAHAWRHWDERIPAPGLTLAERLSGRFRPHGNWILDVFRPLPADEAELLRLYGP